MVNHQKWWIWNEFFRSENEWKYGWICAQSKHCEYHFLNDALTILSVLFEVLACNKELLNPFSVFYISVVALKGNFMRWSFVKRPIVSLRNETNDFLNGTHTRCMYNINLTVLAFQKERKLNSFGIPSLVAYGSFKKDKSTYHFSIIPRFGRSVHDLFVGSERIIPIEILNRIASQIVRNKVFSWHSHTNRFFH